MFERIVTAIETTALALWAGAMAGFAFIFAPIAIKLVPDLTVFAVLVARTIGGVTSFGRACGVIAVVAALVRATRPEARPLAAARVALIAVGLVASAYETTTIIPRMNATAAAIGGPVDSVPKDDPRRAAYDAQHKDSSRVYGLAFLCVLAAVALAPFGRRRAT